ncbi:MAG: leucine-rich repeat domain-containing protein, partial [Eubacterium sp.]|nr:leucine-rich repeat domain-containing protein [Eubacterium sp.]
MKKRFTNLWISIVLAVCQLICLPAISINAETRLSESRHYRAMPYGRTLTDNESVSVVHSEKDTLHGEFYYRTDGDRACITRYLGGGTNVVIPDQLDGYEVGEIGDRAFESCEDIVSVEIPLTVTKIGKHAFGKCGRLESIVIPDSVTEIGSRAFISCESLKDVKLSKNISKIEESVFWECGSLTEVKIPEGVKEICFGAFYFTKIKNVYIPDSVTKVADYAFGLTVEYVSLPEDTKYIKNYSFVNYNGWNQEKIEMELRPAPVRVPEHTEDGEADELALTSAKYVYGEKVVDVLYIAHVIEASHKPFDLYCEVKDQKIAEKYELYSGKKKIAESPDGNFTDLPSDKFEIGERISVCVIGKEKTVATTLLLDIRKDREPGSWKLKLGGDGLAFTLDKRVPYFGGKEVKVDLPSVPVHMVVEDGKVKVGYNIPEKKLYSRNSNDGVRTSGKNKSVKEKIEDWKNDIIKTGKITEDCKTYIESDDLAADFPFMEEKVKVTVFGYAEGEFSDTLESISGQIVVAVSGSATYQSTILVAEVIPVTAYCKVSAKAEADGKATINLIDSAISGNLDYNSSIGVEPFAGIGVGTWLSCGVYGKLDLGLEATLLASQKEPGTDQLYLTGEFGVKAFFAKKEVQKHPVLSSKSWKDGFLGDYVNDKGQLLFYSRTENSLFHQQTGKLSKKNNLHGNDTELFEWNEDSRSVYQPAPY